MKKFCLAIIVFCLFWTFGINFVQKFNCTLDFARVYAEEGKEEQTYSESEQPSDGEDDSENSEKKIGNKKIDSFSDRVIRARIGEMGLGFSASINDLTHNFPILMCSMSLWIDTLYPLLINGEIGIGLATAPMYTDDTFDIAAHAGGNMYFNVHKGHIFVGAGYIYNVLRFVDVGDIGTCLHAVKANLMALDYVKRGLAFNFFLIPYGRYTNNTDLIYDNWAGEPLVKEDTKWVFGWGISVMWMIRKNFL